ncbi:hypothetical protein WA026_022974 [Henosepilachna vigintioctopunctata]|uniref:Uncharacterized protein n=1 Tax=Henosepilachna vigintioctopunctata TaxID=420089 RepID=A0AAW1TZB7_9CUCU
MGKTYIDVEAAKKAVSIQTPPNQPKMWVANSLRMTELRVGHSQMPIGKNGETVQSFPVEKYGLNGSHHILLQGCTYPPEKRSAMALSFGPMTALLCHIRTEEK